MTEAPSDAAVAAASAESQSRRPGPRTTRRDKARPVLPSGDKRWKIVDATMRRKGYRPDALIEVLHTAQEYFGYLDEEALRFAATALHVPLSKAYGVATFYNFFTLKPQGRHACVVCMGTACYVKGAPQVLKAAEETAGIAPGETTADGAVSLVTARCFGSCSLAPVVVFDGEMCARVEPATATDTIEGWMQDDT